MSYDAKVDAVFILILIFFAAIEVNSIRKEVKERTRKARFKDGFDYANSIFFNCTGSYATKKLLGYMSESKEFGYSDGGFDAGIKEAIRLKEVEAIRQNNALLLQGYEL